MENPSAVISCVAYLLLVVGIGLASARFSSAGMGEYFLAGRSLGRVVVALSAVVSGRSSWLLLGFSGMAYVRGVSALWSAVGYILVEFLMFWSMGRRVRLFSERHDCITLPDLFAARFSSSERLLRPLLVVIILVFMVTYVAAQFVGGGKALAGGFGLETSTGVWITAAIVLLYTVLGGFLAVSWTDVLQSVFMIFALLVLPLVAIWDLGGFAVLFEQLREQDASLVDPTAITLGALIGALGIGLGSPGNPHIVVRTMAIQDPDQFRVSAVIGTSWNLLMAMGALFIGLAGRARFADVAELPGGDKEQIYQVLAGDHLHPVLFGIVLAAVFAAIMSTADSQLLVAASSVVRDLIQKTLRRDSDLDPAALVRWSRWCVVALVGVAILLAFFADQVVFWLVLFAWAGLGAALGPPLLLSLYWRGTTGAGVIAGMLTGGAVAFYWRLTPSLKAELYEIVPAFFLSFVVTVVVSLFSRRPGSVDRMFEEMTPPRREK